MQLESLLNATVDKNFDKLEIYTLRNLLTVSNLKEDEGLERWVMLDHYKGINTNGQTADESLTPETIATLWRKVQETEKLHAMLKAEAARNEAILAHLRPLSLQSTADTQRKSLLQSSSPIKTTDQSQPSFSFLTNVSSASTLGIDAHSDRKPLAQNTRFTLSQLPALKTLLQELRPHIASLPRAGPGGEAVRARQAYIETQSRRAMARKGVNSDGTASIGVESLGRPVGVEEVSALEAIVGAFGGPGASSHGARDPDRMEE